MRRTLRHSKAISPYKISVVVLLVFLTVSSFSSFQAKAGSENVGSVANPVTVFEIAGDMKFIFQVCSDNMDLSSATVDFQLGDTVFLGLIGEMYQEGYHPKIANNTLFVVTDSIGTLVWNMSTGEIGGGLFGGMSIVVRWTPEKAGDYIAEIALQDAYSAGNVSSIIPFRVLDPCPFTGQVTELDNGTPISNATIEALQGDEVKAKATTDSEGHFTMQLEKSGIYAVRVSAFGFITTVFKSITTRLENTSLVFSLAPVNSAPTFNLKWTRALDTNCHVAVDLDGNIVTAEGTETVTIIKYDSEGNVVWNISRCFSGQWYPVESIAVDSSKNIFLLLNVDQDGEYNLCTVKLDPFGNEIWEKAFDSGENDFGAGLAVDSQGSVLVAGKIYGSVHRDGALAIIKYDSEGNLASSKILTGYFELGELLIDGENNVILAGSTHRNATDVDYYIAKFDTNNTLVWEQTFTSDGDKADYCKGGALDSSGNMIVIGDKCLIKLNPNGSILWNRHFTGKDLVVDANDDIIAIDGSFVEMFAPSGHFIGQISLADDLCSISLDRKGNLVVAGAQFLTKLSYGVPQALIQQDSVARGVVTNQLSLEMSDSTLSFVFIIPLLVTTTLSLGIFHKKEET